MGNMKLGRTKLVIIPNPVKLTFVVISSDLPLKKGQGRIYNGLICNCMCPMISKIYCRFLVWKVLNSSIILGSRSPQVTLTRNHTWKQSIFKEKNDGHLMHPWSNKAFKGTVVNRKSIENHVSSPFKDIYLSTVCWDWE